MTAEQWTWLLLASELVAAYGLYQAGRRKWWAWMLVLQSSTAWMTYGLIYRIPAFVAMSTLWTAIHTTNTIRWWNDN